MTNSVKRHFARFFSVIFSASLLFSAYGCQKGSIDPADYPTPEIDETAVNDHKDEPVVTDSSSLYKDALKPEPNSLKENGKYVFNPAVIPQSYLTFYRDSPKVIKIAKDLLMAVDNVDTEFELDIDEEVSAEDFDNASMVAYFANPMMSVVDYVPLDEDTYEFKYFPTYYITSDSDPLENGAIDLESRDEVSTEEASRYLENFKSYVTDVINNNCTAEDTQAEMAEKIYKALVKDFELELPEYDSYMIDPTTGGLNDEPVYSAGEIIMSVYNRKFTRDYQFIALYSFILQQLHIEVMEVSGYNGVFTQDIKDKEIVPKSNVEYMTWQWQIVCLDGQYYHCDLLLEKLAYDKRYSDVSGADPDMTYFGMSDTKRCESYRFSKSSLYVSNGPSYAAMQGMDNGNEVPECPDSYGF